MNRINEHVFIKLLVACRKNLLYLGRVMVNHKVFTLLRNNMIFAVIVTFFKEMSMGNFLSWISAAGSTVRIVPRCGSIYTVTQMHRMSLLILGSFYNAGIIHFQCFHPRKLKRAPHRWLIQLLYRVVMRCSSVLLSCEFYRLYYAPVTMNDIPCSS